MELNTKLYIEENGEKFMGIGVLWLLKKIEEQGSLRAAAQSLGLSYSKAYKMVSNLESALKEKIVDRKKGGQSRDGITLTPFALQFIELYDNFQKECKNLLVLPFEKFKENLDKLDK